jgi:fucose 4-O-acetylase-like acetyltransferase
MITFRVFTLTLPFGNSLMSYSGRKSLLILLLRGFISYSFSPGQLLRADDSNPLTALCVSDDEEAVPT